MQRVSKASVRVRDDMLGAIGPGMVVLAGFAPGDDAAGVSWMARRLAGLRVFADAAGRMNVSLADSGGEALVVSQFTLLGDASKGRRPSFAGAARPGVAAPLFEALAAALDEELGGGRVRTGRFGAEMQVSLVNDGPVTLVLDR